MKRIYKPESLMSSFGYEPQWSEGAIKPPVFHSSTFCFKSAEQGKAFFETAYGLNAGDLEKDTGLIYSRINNPNIEIVENRISLLDYAEETALFSSGMSAISTVLLEFLKPGDLLLFSRPVYGGTDHLIQTYLNDFGIKSIGFGAKDSFEDIIKMVEDSGHGDNLSVIFVESPANPTNDIFDLRMLRAIGDYFSTSNKKVYLGVDNTFMGPLWCSPLNLGADLVIYSATKYLGGHSDLIAGAVSGDSELITRIKNLRTFLGCIPGPETAWLLSRSLETLHVRMRMQMENAKQIADLLSMHPGVSSIHYLGLIPVGTREFDLYKRQYYIFTLSLFLFLSLCFVFPSLSQGRISMFVIQITIKNSS